MGKDDTKIEVTGIIMSLPISGTKPAPGKRFDYKSIVNVHYRMDGRDRMASMELRFPKETPEGLLKAISNRLQATNN